MFQIRKSYIPPLLFFLPQWISLFFDMLFNLWTSNLVWSAVFCSSPSSISNIIIFHPADDGDCNNLMLLLQGDTIPLWLIEVPSEIQRRCRSSRSHSLTGNPLCWFISRRQQPLKLPAVLCCAGGVFIGQCYWSVLLTGRAKATLGLLEMGSVTAETCEILCTLHMGD